MNVISKILIFNDQSQSKSMQKRKAFAEIEHLLPSELVKINVSLVTCISSTGQDNYDLS